MSKKAIDTISIVTINFLCYIITRLKNRKYLRLIKLILKSLYQSTIHLHCCVSFRCTVKKKKSLYIYLHSFLDSFPIGHWRELTRVSCAVQHVLIIYRFYV